MNCPFCKHKNTRVLDSRLIKEGYSIRRRRSCSECERRFTTYEHVEVSLPRIFKKDGRREDYKREKIYSGIEKACQKLPVSPDQIDAIINSIEKKLMELNQQGVSARHLGNLVMMHLKYLDPVAFVRFASVYQTFGNIDEFVENLKTEDEAFIVNQESMQ